MCFRGHGKQLCSGQTDSSAARPARPRPAPPPRGAWPALGPLPALGPALGSALGPALGPALGRPLRSALALSALRSTLRSTLRSALRSPAQLCAQPLTLLRSAPPRPYSTRAGTSVRERTRCAGYSKAKRKAGTRHWEGARGAKTCTPPRKASSALPLAASRPLSEAAFAAPCRRGWPSCPPPRLQHCQQLFDVCLLRSACYLFIILIMIALLAVNQP